MASVAHSVRRGFFGFKTQNHKRIVKNPPMDRAKKRDTKPPTSDGIPDGSDIMKIRFAILALIGATALSSCGGDTASDRPAAADEAATPNNSALLAAALAGAHRTQEERARDQYRRPRETLLFFDIEPGMSVVEIWPGGGWYTQVIAPYLKTGDGKYYAAGFSREGASERTLRSIARFEETYMGKPALYGDVEMTVLGDGQDIAPAGSADAVLTFRNVHNWTTHDRAEGNFAKFYRALKPGGILGVVDHRGDGAELPDNGSSGYLYEADVIALANGAGFDFEASSEINANAADTKDHPFGVWTLPPVRRESEIRGAEDPDFDHSTYDAIGESDRMTLKFRKPVAADGALLE